MRLKIYGLGENLIAETGWVYLWIDSEKTGKTRQEFCDPNLEVR